MASLDEMLAQAALPAHQDRVLRMHAEFEARTGAFSIRDSFFEARSAAFWDDALTHSDFTSALAPTLSEAARELLAPFERAHRGIFRVEPREETETDGFLLVDEWSGAEFECEPSSSGLRDALERAAGMVDGRVVGVPRTRRIVLLPGAVFHPADAQDPMRALIPEARTRNLSTQAFLDALLRMDHALRALSRVKAAFAYRKAALPR